MRDPYTNREHKRPLLFSSPDKQVNKSVILFFSLTILCKTLPSRPSPSTPTIFSSFHKSRYALHEDGSLDFLSVNLKFLNLLQNDTPVLTSFRTQILTPLVPFQVSIVPRTTLKVWWEGRNREETQIFGK